MDFSTVQKLEFKPIPPTERPKAFKIIEKYEPPKEPLDGRSAYQDDYPSKDQFEKTQIIKRNANATT